MQPDSSSSHVRTDEYRTFLNLVSSYYELEPKFPVEVDFAAQTHAGKVRESNQDHFLVVRRRREREILATSLPEELLVESPQLAYTFAIADGVGGRAFGELASFLALRTGWDLGEGEVKWTLKINANESEDLKKKAKVFFDLVHKTLQASTLEEPRLSGMGTTLTVAYTVGAELYIMHAGDTRAYLFRAETLTRLTRDHNLAQAMLDAGLAEPGSPEERRSRRILTNVLGGDQSKVTVDVEHLRLENEDRLLLCSDGLSDLVEDSEMCRILTRFPNSREATEALVQSALDAGGKDNVTAIVAAFRFPEGTGHST